MSAIREKLTSRVQSTLDKIELAMKSQLHLEDSKGILVDIETIENLSSILKEDEKEFISAVRFAIDKQLKWE